MKKLLNKKILMVVDAWFPHVGGGQIHVWELSKALVDLGYLVTIYTRDLGETNLYYKGITIKRVGHFKKFTNIFGRLEFLLVALIYSLFADYQILHLHAFSPGLLAPVVKFFRPNKKIVFTVHGKGFKIAGLQVSGDFLENLVFYKIAYDLEITVAKSTLTQKVKAINLAVIPNGVDIKKFNQVKRTKKKITNILYVGRLSFEKGTDLLIQAFEQLGDDSLKLSIVGEGPQFNNLKKIANNQNIHFKGSLFNEDLLLEYKKSDLLVLPSRTEGLPLVIFEALASKLPVLTTDVGDIKSYIKDNQNGFLTKPDVNSLKEKIKKVIGFKDFNRITENGYLTVSDYDWSKIAIKTSDWYQNL